MLLWQLKFNVHLPRVKEGSAVSFFVCFTIPNG